MSDILIKNMKMPESCSQCNFCQGFECVALKRKFNRICKEDCPLIEVPTPHGRLIDADAYHKEIRERYQSAKEWYDEAEDDEIIGRAEATMITFTECSLTLQNMPTIIESDIDVMYYPQVDGITPTVIKGEAEGCEDG